MPTTGVKELSAQLSKMGKAPGGKALRAAAMQAMLPAMRAAQKAAPVANPPYEYGGVSKDPYPVRTYKGRLRTPGFAKRNIARKAKVSKDRRSVRVMLGVRPEAFYAVQFIELGTSKIPKRPWLEPSFRNSIPEVNSRFKERLKALIDKAAKAK
jgi:HK97 gp10 family phage protein